MFGVVPKVVWAKSQIVDEQNRIQMVTRTLIAANQAASRLVLVDTGLGSKWEPEKAARYAIEPDPDALEDAIAHLGATVDDVTDVILTHLHFDHCGGLTEWADGPGGPTKLKYPKARHWIHVDQWRHANNPSDRDRASFIPTDFAGLEKAGVLEFIDGEGSGRPFDGVSWIVSNGHTPGQLLPVFQGDGPGRRVLFICDLVPTVAHLPPAWTMGFDVYPLTTVAERKGVYRRCADERLLIAFPHDRENGIVAVDFDEKKPRVVETVG